MKLAPPQVNRAELLDLGRGTPGEVARSLHDIRRINNYLGGSRVALDATMRLLAKHRLQQPTVLDIGTGSADIPLRLVAHADKQKIRLQVIALDNSYRHLQVARSHLGGAPRIQLLQADAFCLPFPDNSVDVVVASLFLHHFRPEQIVPLWREFGRVARVGWVMNDIVRHYLPLVFFRLAAPVFARSYITRHDGIASLRRAYTVAEMTQIAAASGVPGIGVHRHFPYRMSVVCEKP